MKGIRKLTLPSAPPVPIFMYVAHVYKHSPMFQLALNKGGNYCWLNINLMKLFRSKTSSHLCQHRSVFSNHTQFT